MLCKLTTHLIELFSVLSSRRVSSWHRNVDKILANLCIDVIVWPSSCRYRTINRLCLICCSILILSKVLLPTNTCFVYRSLLSIFISSFYCGCGVCWGHYCFLQKKNSTSCSISAFNWKRCVFRSLVVLALLFIAESVPRDVWPVIS